MAGTLEKLKLNMYIDNPREPCGYYTPPRSFKIAGIDSLVVDPHNEVLPHWYKTPNPPAVLVHIDKHPDMDTINTTTFETVKKEWSWESIDSISKYAKHCISVSDFISVAIHYGLVGVVYYFDPREDNIKAYGRVMNGELVNRPKTKENDSGMIKWNPETTSPIPQSISIIQSIEDLSKCKYPIILDIDLDAYLCTKDLNGQDPSVAKIRFQNVEDVISKLPKPTIITLARSQSPTLWCPMDKVDHFERKTIDYLESLYRV